MIYNKKFAWTSCAATVGISLDKSKFWSAKDQLLFAALCTCSGDTQKALIFSNML